MISGVEAVICVADRCGVRADTLLIPKSAMASSIVQVTSKATVELLQPAPTHSLNVPRSKSVISHLSFFSLLVFDMRCVLCCEYRLSYHTLHCTAILPFVVGLEDLHIFLTTTFLYFILMLTLYTVI